MMDIIILTAPKSESRNEVQIVVSFTNAPDFRITQETPVYTKQEITLEILKTNISLFICF